MREAMLDHGLDEPSYAEDDGFFIVTFPGPKGDFDRINAASAAGTLISPAIESQLFTMSDRKRSCRGCRKPGMLAVGGAGRLSA